MSVNVQLAAIHICLVVKEKQMKKTAKNNEQNDQTPALFGIIRQISDKIYLQDVHNCRMYLKVYRCI